MCVWGCSLPQYKGDAVESWAWKQLLSISITKLSALESIRQWCGGNPIGVLGCVG